ncbi:HNH endonuclease [Vagococcus fluvialis]|uniref:HNH endonuclease n=1 Tax=Vagococcus fluvialis TaxID=2738 RepID=UPI003D151307
MRNLSKLAKPRVLKNNESKWKELLASGQATEYIKTRYRHDEIKAKLNEETHGKCAYCEGKYKSTSFLRVEHMLPKTIFTDKTYEWKNLTNSCEVCNNRKGDTYKVSTGENLLNPYNDNVEEELFFIGSFIAGRNEKAVESIDIYDLNRAELVEDRQQKITDILLTVQQYKIVAENNPLKRMYKKELERAVQPSSEFSKCLDWFIESSLTA